jgi:hypothetical protein
MEDELVNNNKGQRNIEPLKDQKGAPQVPPGRLEKRKKRQRRNRRTHNT